MKRIVMTFPLLLGACGTLPEPFYGDPGTAGAKLAVPPAPVLAIPNLAAAGLDDASGEVYATDLANALNALDVPSLARAPKPSEWRLTAKVTTSGGFVTPSYAIIGPDGKNYGVQTGTPVDAASWAAGDPGVLSQEATTDATAISNKLAAINASVQQSNPNSLENRPPRLFLGAVTGAPGDGDNALTIAMLRDLPGGDTKLVTDPADADFTITGHVKTQPDTNNQLLVELDWVVQDTSHRKIGQVTQLHDLKPGDIEPYWGDVAAAAAAEAATGVNEVITNATLRKSKHLADADSTDGDDAPLVIPQTFALPAPSEAANQSAFDGGAAPAPETVASAAPASASSPLSNPPGAAPPAAAPQPSSSAPAPAKPGNSLLADIATPFRATAALAGGVITRIGQIFNPPALQAPTAPQPPMLVAAQPAVQGEPIEDPPIDVPQAPVAAQVAPAQPASILPEAAATPLVAVPRRPQVAGAVPERRVIAQQEPAAAPAAPDEEAFTSTPAATPAPAVTPADYVATAPRKPDSASFGSVPDATPAIASTQDAASAPVTAELLPPPEAGPRIQDPADTIER